MNGVMDDGLRTGKVNLVFYLMIHNGEKLIAYFV